MEFALHGFVLAKDMDAAVSTLGRVRQVFQGHGNTTSVPGLLDHFRRAQIRSLYRFKKKSFMRS